MSDRRRPRKKRIRYFDGSRGTRNFMLRLEPKKGSATLYITGHGRDEKVDLVEDKNTR